MRLTESLMIRQHIHQTNINNVDISTQLRIMSRRKALISMQLSIIACLRVIVSLLSYAVILIKLANENIKL